MRACFTTLLLITAITLIAIGIHVSNYTSMFIGGALVGVYDIITIGGED